MTVVVVVTPLEDVRFNTSVSPEKKITWVVASPLRPVTTVSSQELLLYILITSPGTPLPEVVFPTKKDIFLLTLTKGGVLVDTIVVVLVIVAVDTLVWTLVVMAVVTLVKVEYKVFVLVRVTVEGVLAASSEEREESAL